MSLTLAEYENIRSNPTHFVIAHGHERFAVIEKVTGEAERIAVETDPRS